MSPKIFYPILSKNLFIHTIRSVHTVRNERKERKNRFSEGIGSKFLPHSRSLMSLLKLHTSGGI